MKATIITTKRTFVYNPKTLKKLNDYAKLNGLKKNKIADDSINEYIDSRVINRK